MRRCLWAAVVLTFSTGWGRLAPLGDPARTQGNKPAGENPREGGQSRSGDSDGDGDGGRADNVALAGFNCTVPAEVEADTDIEVVCVVPPGVDLAKAILRFRPGARSSYFARVMVASPNQSADLPRNPSWRGTIPGHVLSGRSVHLYVEAASRMNKPVVTWNTQQSPHVVMLQVRDVDDVDETPEPAAVVEENPLEDRDDEPPPYRRRQFWVGLGVGGGMGWSLESGPEAARANPAYSLDFHLAPQIGYHLSPRIALALAGRHQWIQQPTRGSAEASSAHLGLLRLLAHAGTGRHRLYAAAAVGAGNGFRMVFSADGSPGGGRPTVRGGPLVGGLAGGYVGDLTRSRLAFTAEVGGLAGFPDTAIVVDLRLGLAAYF